MGSNTKSKRKRIDAPIIRVPASFSSIISESSGNAKPEEASDKCPPSFQEKLEESPLLKQGIKLALSKLGDRYSIMILGEEVGLVSKRNSQKITQCLELGVAYFGEIIFYKGEYHARFFRQGI